MIGIEPLSGPTLSHGKSIAAFAAIVDQAWLSVLNLAVSLAFVRTAPKEEFGAYVLLLTPIFLMQGLHNALFLSPQATVLPASPPESKAIVRATSSSLQAGFALASGVLSAVALLVYQHLTVRTVDPVLALAFGFGTVGALAREGVRAAHYVDGMATRALQGDLIYGSLLIACLALFVAGDEVTARNVLAAMGLAGVLPLARVALQGRSFKADLDVWKRFWACGRWALPAVIVTWLNLNSYTYVAATILGAAALADINAARLVMMPVGMAIAAWSNVARPKISALYARREIAAIRHFSLTSIAAGWLALAGFVLLVVIAYPAIEALLGESYAGLLPLALAWGGFFCANLPRTILMATLMTTSSGYRALHHFSWLALLLLVPGLAVLAGLGAVWVIGVLCAVELTLALLIGRSARARWRTGV